VDRPTDELLKRLLAAADADADERVTRLLTEGYAEGGGSSAAGGFGLVPLGGIAGEFAAVRITEADAHAVVGHAQGGKHGFHQTEAAQDFLRELLLGDAIALPATRSALLVGVRSTPRSLLRSPRCPLLWARRVAIA
jgi:hypothetical protein